MSSTDHRVETSRVYTIDLTIAELQALATGTSTVLLKDDFPLEPERLAHAALRMFEKDDELAALAQSEAVVVQLVTRGEKSVRAHSIPIGVRLTQKGVVGADSIAAQIADMNGVTLAGGKAAMVLMEGDSDAPRELYAAMAGAGAAAVKAAASRRAAADATAAPKTNEEKLRFRFRDVTQASIDSEIDTAGDKTFVRDGGNIHHLIRDAKARNDPIFSNLDPATCTEWKLDGVTFRVMPTKEVDKAKAYVEKYMKTYAPLAGVARALEVELFRGDGKAWDEAPAHWNAGMMGAWRNQTVTASFRLCVVCSYPAVDNKINAAMRAAARAAL